MRRLAKWTTITLLVSTTLLGSAVLYGRALAGPDKLRNWHYFGVCHGKPCFLGLVPGITNWVDAKATIETYSPRRSRDLSWISSVIMTSDDPITGGHIQSIQIVDLEGEILPSFRYFLLRYGMPCKVTYANDISSYGAIGLLYPTMVIWLERRSDYLTMDQPVRSVTLNDPNSVLGKPSYCSAVWNSLFVPWLGFTSLDDYRAHGLNIDN
jgi:hypothetical protein